MWEKRRRKTQRALPIMLIRRICAPPLFAIHRVFTRQLTLVQLPPATRAHAAHEMIDAAQQDDERTASTSITTTRVLPSASRAHAAEQDEQTPSTSGTVIPLHSTPLPSRSRETGAEHADEAAAVASSSVSAPWDFPPPERWGSDELLMSG